MPNQKELDHAGHNETAAQFVHAKATYHDWVATIAFYSALHYVRGSIFPLTENGKTHKSFIEYCNEKGITQKQHKVLKGLVREHLSSIAGKYRWLHDTSQNARYIEYRLSPAIANESMNKLAEIKAVCSPEIHPGRSNTTAG